MDFRLMPEEEAFKQEFQAWLKENLPQGWKPTFVRSTPAEYRAFQRTLFEGGYAALHYPKAYGGREKGNIYETIVNQALSQVCPNLRGMGTITHGMAVPVIYNCGTEEQKKEHLPKIFDGTHIWCQGFSEPGAGSDVANVSTLAVRDGDYYVINGQKVWTSLAHAADWCILLVRTDPKAKKHRGLSYLLLDMRLPGIEVKPIKQITGESEFNEIFLTDVKVPVERLLGTEGEGWRIAITTLMFERVMGDAVKAASYEANVRSLFEAARETMQSGRPILEDPLYRQNLGQAFIEVMVLKYHGLRNLSQQLSGGIPGPEGSIGKLLWSLPNQSISENALLGQGPMGQVMDGSPWAIEEGARQYDFLRAKGSTIEAGTTEIQRNIIGERVLGLPKDPSRAVER